MCGIEVESFDTLPADIGRIRIQPQHYAVFLHSGHISDIRVTCQRIWNEWLPNSQYQSANKPDFEKYDHRFNLETKSGEVEFWLSISEKNV
jgi:predicted transcriptional regulator YdeE